MIHFFGDPDNEIIAAKSNKNLSDKEIKSIVTNQGYVVTKIDREI